MRSDLVDLDVILHRETYPGEPEQGAYLVESPTSSPRKEWVPKSVTEVEWHDRVRKTATITLPQSWAESKGLV